MSEVTTEQAEDQETPKPIAMIAGVEVTELPQDLYIPPEALEIFLEAFEGPLDLLLYMIKKQNIDILNIPIASITRQYIQYVDVMKETHFELAAEYLVMAAMLAEIKSRMLLPRTVNEEGEIDDPRAELVRRLQEYERYKKAAEDLDELPRRERDTFAASAEPPELDIERPQPQINFNDLLLALKDVMHRAQLRTSHHIEREPLSVRERMSAVLDRLDSNEFVAFTSLFNADEGRQGVVVTFIAILELLKGSMIEMVQAEIFAPIHVRRPQPKEE